MKRRRSREEGGVSLFPFMSILAGLIGILVLMISVITQLKELDRQGRTQEEVDRALENRNLGKSATEVSRAIADLDKKIARDHSKVTELAELEKRQIALRLKLEEIRKARNSDKTDAELQKIAENLKLEIAALKGERPDLKTQLAKLEAELKQRKEAPKPMESVVVRPGGIGSRTARNLFFVECNSTGITLMEKGRPPTSISKAVIGRNDAYNKYLQRVKQTRDSMVLYLVRKSGYDSYRWAAGWAESKFSLTTGKLPVPNDGPIDLSLFD